MWAESVLELTQAIRLPANSGSLPTTELLFTSSFAKPWRVRARPVATGKTGVWGLLEPVLMSPQKELLTPSTVAAQAGGQVSASLVSSPSRLWEQQWPVVLVAP